MPGIAGSWVPFAGNVVLTKELPFIEFSKYRENANITGKNIFKTKRTTKTNPIWIFQIQPFSQFSSIFQHPIYTIFYFTNFFPIYFHFNL